MKQGLLLIDIQNDYFPGGKYELEAPEKAAEETAKVLKYFRERNLPIFHICHINTSLNAAFLKPNSVGTEFFKTVAPKENETKIIKHSPDSFLKTNLKEKLEAKGITHLVVCGMMTHMCVDTTVRAAAKYGYDVTLISDACATRDLVWEDEVISAKEVQGAFLAALASGFAKVIKAEKWLKMQE